MLRVRSDAPTASPLQPVPLFGISRHRKDRVVAKVAALMHELGEILGETSIPNRSPYLSSAA